jgi:glyceraldehyde 3-phosphate dehydrogenase
MRIAINGFGRIGKSFLRTIMLDPMAARKLDVVVINIGPANIENVALLFRYDTIMGAFPGTVEQKNNCLIIDGKKIEIIAETDPLKISWKDRGIDWVIDCSGKFTSREKAELHLQAGAKSVLISAPAKGEVLSIVPGVNEQNYKLTDKIVSLGSCTTNAFLTMLKVLYEECGLDYAAMTTVHAYTNSQALLDVDCKDPRRSRAAALNIVPTTTGAASMVKKIIPALDGKIEAFALRVPVGIVSYIHLVFTATKKLSVETINNALLEASTTRMKGIMDFSMEPLVSSDFIGSQYSVIIDGLATKVVGPLAEVAGWYDNEWGYSMRIKDFLLFIKGKTV